MSGAPPLSWRGGGCDQALQAWWEPSAIAKPGREVSEELTGRISRLKMKRGQSDLSTESGESVASRAWSLLSFWASEKEDLKDSGDYFSSLLSCGASAATKVFDPGALRPIPACLSPSDRCLNECCHSSGRSELFNKGQGKAH